MPPQLVRGDTNSTQSLTQRIAGIHYPGITDLGISEVIVYHGVVHFAEGNSTNSTIVVFLPNGVGAVPPGTGVLDVLNATVWDVGANIHTEFLSYVMKLEIPSALTVNAGKDHQPRRSRTRMPMAI